MINILAPALIHLLHLDKVCFTSLVKNAISPGPAPITCISPLCGANCFFDSAIAKVTAPKRLVELIIRSSFLETRQIIR